MSLLVRSADLVCWHGGQGWRTWLAGSVARGLAGRVSVNGGPGQRALLAGSASLAGKGGTAGRVGGRGEPGGAGIAGRIRQGQARWCGRSW